MTWTAKDLEKLSIEARYQVLPENLKTILNSAIRTLKPIRVWVFGSRARGDARETSDFDIAIDWKDGLVSDWIQFTEEVSDAPPTLHHYDLVDFNDADKGLQHAILKEGILIYER